MSSNHSPQTWQCSIDDNAVEAVILYPSLGMPMVLGEGQEVCSLILATGSTALSLFEWGAHEDKEEVEKEKGQGIWLAGCAYDSIDRHLRLTSMDKPKYGFAEDTTQGTLFGDGTCYDVAARAVKVWHLGKMADGMTIYNRHNQVLKRAGGGERGDSPIAVLAPGLFTKGGPYAGLTELWEVEINLTELPKKIGKKEFLNWAWLVKTKDEHRKDGNEGNYFTQKEYHEPQDRMIENYLKQRSEKEKYRYLAPEEFHERDLKSACLAPFRDYVHHLQSWHPVIRATKLPLNVAHLSDLHINIRQNLLSQTPACVLETGEGEETKEVIATPTGGRICNTLNAAMRLCEQAAKRQTDGVHTLLLLTGDYIDYNCNLLDIDRGNVRNANNANGANNADKVCNAHNTGKNIGDIWKDSNILANASNPEKYRHGPDHLLTYSLVCHAYRQLKLPVFMTTGNHESMVMPYGVSPRTTSWIYKMGVVQLGGACSRESWLAKRLRKNTEAASRWAEGKADERIPADLNLSIYEAILACGPCYGQTYDTLANADAKLHDWFYLLFTPFCDALLTFGSRPDKAEQILTLLGWGKKGRFISFRNLLNGRHGVDQRGKGFLHGAQDSIGRQQLALLETARAIKGETKTPWIVGSHFTIFNYLAQRPFQVKGKRHEGRFTPADSRQSDNVEYGAFPKQTPPGDEGAQYNDYNWGGCELGLKSYLLHHAPRVDWHFTGHSHRAGLYRMKGNYDGNGPVTMRGFEPELESDKLPAEAGPRFVVSGCSGPISLQNLGDELSGYTLRPPLGTWVNLETNEMELLKAPDEENNEKPRLSVALDYLQIGDNHYLPHERPLVFEYGEEGKAGQAASMNARLRVSEQALPYLRIEALYVWVFTQEMNKNKKNSGYWQRIQPKLKREQAQAGSYWLLSFEEEWEKLETVLLPCRDGKFLEEKAKEMVVDEGIFRRTLSAFCVIPLNDPGTPWSRDMKIDDWVFPLEIGVEERQVEKSLFLKEHFPVYVQVPFFRRPIGELGEVPDWKFRAKYFGHRGYPPAEEVILLVKKLSKKF